MMMRGERCCKSRDEFFFDMPMMDDVVGARIGLDYLYVDYDGTTRSYTMGLKFDEPPSNCGAFPIYM